MEHESPARGAPVVSILHQISSESNRHIRDIPGRSLALPGAAASAVYCVASPGGGGPHGSCPASPASPAWAKQAEQANSLRLWQGRSMEGPPSLTESRPRLERSCPDSRATAPSQPEKPYTYMLTLSTARLPEWQEWPSPLNCQAAGGVQASVPAVGRQYEKQLSSHGHHHPHNSPSPGHTLVMIIAPCTPARAMCTNTMLSLVLALLTDMQLIDCTGPVLLDLPPRLTEHSSTHPPLSRASSFRD